LFDYNPFPDYDPAQVEPRLPGIWRYRHALGLPDDAPQITLGEGRTPLVWSQAFGRRVAFKCEALNPTGSYKDRGSAALTAFLRSRGVEQAVEDSSGNAGASFAAYAAAAGVRARVFVPDAASGPKRKQIEAYGAEIVRIMGPRSNASEAALRAVEQGAVYASHANLPFVLPGYATLAYELFEDLGQAPGAVIVPAGQGNLLLGVGRAFAGMQRRGLAERMPVMVGVQALACAPLWMLFAYGPSAMGWSVEGDTLAEGVRVRHPVRGDAVLNFLMQYNGRMLAVEEPAILPGRAALARLGFYVEPTSALVWDALEQSVADLPDPLVVVLTGSGLKSP
jgi:threonine synthase